MLRVTLLLTIGCNSQVNLHLNMSGKLLEKDLQFEYLLGKYNRTKNNQSINNWINENHGASPFNAGIWKDVQTNQWFIGEIPKSINSDDCGGGNLCTCKFRNPSIINCPHEKMMLKWERHATFFDWEEINSEDLQIKPKLGNNM